MSYVHGKNTQITVAGSVVKAKTSAFNRARDSHDTSGYGDDGHTFGGGLTNGTFTMSGVYDNTVTTGNIAVLEAAWEDTDNDEGALEIVRYPEGNTSGKPKQTFTAVMTGLDQSDPVDDMVQWTANFQISGSVTPGTVSP